MSEAVVVREELVDRVRPARLVLIEAPGGSGKTTFAEQLVADWEGITIRVRITARRSITSWCSGSRS